MKFLFDPGAERDLLEAVEYYEDCRAGLGEDFSVEVRSAIERVCDHPLAWPVVKERYRRCLVSRFPYGIVYRVESDRIIVMAVMHLHRHPESWAHRDKQP